MGCVSDFYLLQTSNFVNRRIDNEEFFAISTHKDFFGSRCVNKIAKFFRGCGNSCLLVTYHPSKLAKAQKQVCEKLISLLEEAGIRVEYYYGALPNPTTDCVDDGVHAAKQKKWIVF